MSSETGNLVQFMFHTKFPFDCDKYASVQSQHRIPIQTPKIWLKQKSHLVDSCNLQIWLTNSSFAANIQMRISFFIRNLSLEGNQPFQIARFLHLYDIIPNKHALAEVHQLIGKW